MMVKMPDSDRVIRADWTEPRHRMVTAANGQRPSGRSAAVGSAPLGDGGNKTATTTPEELSELYQVLMDADDRGDPEALARLGWVLFTKASVAQQVHREATDLLGELGTAARAVIAGDGSPASLALLRHVLARRGWLPPRDATPLQVLAAPACEFCSVLRDQALVRHRRPGEKHRITNSARFRPVS
jgi:hypothetical protein